MCKQSSLFQNLSAKALLLYSSGMLKRFGISFCIILAFGLLQAHNFVAHHHHVLASADHEYTDANTHHHHHDANDHTPDQDGESRDNDSPFSDATHTADFGKILVKPDASQPDIDSPLLIACLIQAFHLQPAFVSCHLKVHPPDKGTSLHIIFLSHSLPSRAPPISSYVS
jgi:hypothetical protein